MRLLGATASGLNACAVGKPYDKVVTAATAAITRIPRAISHKRGR